MDKIKMIEAEYTKKEIPKFGVGDTIRVMTKIYEADDKVRLHPFEGLVISRDGSGIRQNFTVRRVSYGEGIERVFPLYSPDIERIEIMKAGKVHRSKLYYLRGKIGKQATKIESADTHIQEKTAK